MAQTTYKDPIDPASKLFASLCEQLNCMVGQSDAECAVDLLAGGFKFSDEIPSDYEKLGERLPAFVDLMRCLWAYRASIVVGKPRRELAGYWEAARKLAPRWAGFAAERSSEDMKLHVDEVARRTKEFIDEIARIDRSLAPSPAPT